MMKMDEVTTVRECCRMNSEGQDGPGRKIKDDKRVRKMIIQYDFVDD